MSVHGVYMSWCQTGSDLGIVMECPTRGTVEGVLGDAFRFREANNKSVSLLSRRCLGDLGRRLLSD